MEIRRLLPYLAGLVFLAFALGSLPRGQSGGSLLFQSYWLLYLIYLAPLSVLFLMAGLIILIGLNWRTLSEGIGRGMSRRRKTGKPRSMKSIFITILFWGLALGVLISRQRASPSTNSTSTLEHQIVGEKASVPGTVQIGNGVGLISNLIQSGWFNILFLGLIVVCGFVLVQSLRFAFEKSSSPDTLYATRQEEGLQAVATAMKQVHDETLDPRSRIIACYETVINAAFRLGASISSDQTARELEARIRSMFSLRGAAIHELTALFEEARYSLHEITEEDASRALEHLHAIYGELDIQNDLGP